MQQEDAEKQVNQAQLSDIWQQLLGHSQSSDSHFDADDSAIPALESDPWSALLRAHGIEIVDLQQMQLHISPQDVERALQIMREQSEQAQHDESDSDDL